MFLRLLVYMFCLVSGAFAPLPPGGKSVPTHFSFENHFEKWAVSEVLVLLDVFLVQKSVSQMVSRALEVKHLPPW